MKNEKLKSEILSILNEIESEYNEEQEIESLGGAYSSLVKFLLNQVKIGKFKRNYDIDTNSGRMVFTTKGGKKVVFNDGKIGITAFKTWKGKKDKAFFDYSDHKEILKFSLAG